MLAFVTRRLLATVLVLLAASFIVYTLTAISGDPLADLRDSTSANREELINARRELLQLDIAPPIRYFHWLAALFTGDLGASFSRGGQPVSAAIASAAGSTIQLVTGATILAIVIGIAIGVVTALRQYSGFDYTVTFLTFVVYSLPIFFIAVLLKEYGAIRFNAFLAEPRLDALGYLITGLVSGVVWMSILGGDWRRRLITFAAASGGAVLLLGFLILSGWFTQPSIGVVGIVVIGAAIAAGATVLSTGLGNRRVLFSALTSVALWAALWYPLQFLFYFVPEWWILPLLIVAAVAAGLLAGRLIGGDSRREAMRVGVITGGLTVLLVIADRVLLVYPDYLQRIPQSGAIATIGSSTPGLQGDLWFQLMDSFTHLLLPTIALSLISLAVYSRYARSSLLEVMNMDYVRTARAKGLNERTVVVRHALRNAMIPIATIIAFDIGSLIGGAVITERIFAWKGMGSLFTDGLAAVDVNLVMGFFVVTAVLAVLFNLVADLIYSALDPRIRVAHG